MSILRLLHVRDLGEGRSLYRNHLGDYFEIEVTTRTYASDVNGTRGALVETASGGDRIRAARIEAARGGGRPR